MRILVLGGTVFLSRAVAVEAVARGHEVVCASRGASGAVPSGTTHVTFDRSGPVPASLAAEAFDAVVDVARIPSWVRRAVEAWPDAHWTFVSTVNVYEDESTPGGTPATLALRSPEPDDVDLAEHPEALVYDPTPKGKRLVALEYIVFKDAWRKEHKHGKPHLFGQTFEKVGPGNRFGIPAFYELHVWAWKHNRSGTFNDWNPRVTC